MIKDRFQGLKSQVKGDMGVYQNFFLRLFKEIQRNCQAILRRQATEIKQRLTSRYEEKLNNLKIEVQQVEVLYGEKLREARSTHREKLVNSNQKITSQESHIKSFEGEL